MILSSAMFRAPTFAQAMLTLLLVFAVALAPMQGFAESDTPVSAEVEVEGKNPDPLEKWNRKVYAFNNKVDRAVLKPVAKRYVKHVPERVRRGVKNFVNNLREPTTVVNDLLQGKFKQAGKDTARFLINTTVGVLGIMDVAKKVNLPRNREDFGQTMGKWGVPPGPFLMLPFLGPSNLRDTTGLIPQYMYTDLTAGIEDDAVLWSIFTARAIDTRAELLSADKMLESQVDPYVFLRESYSQRRIHEINDGRTVASTDDETDDLLDEILLEEGLE